MNWKILNRTWFLWAVALVWGCSEPAPTDPGGPPASQTGTCLGCHSSEDALKAALGTEKTITLPIVSEGDG
jgi:hypothetical protein